MCRNVCVLSSSWSDSEWFIRHRLSLCFMLFILQKPFLWMEHFVKVTAFRFPCWVVLPYDTDCILWFPRGLEKWHPSENPWDSTSNLRWVTPSTHPPEMFQKKKKKDGKILIKFFWRNAFFYIQQCKTNEFEHKMQTEWMNRFYIVLPVLEIP